MELEEKLSKGRPRKEEEGGFGTIKDELFGKYYIKITKDQYEVMQTATVAKEKTLGYYTTLNAALSKIARLQMDITGRHFTLKGFINEYKELINKLNKQFL